MSVQLVCNISMYSRDSVLPDRSLENPIDTISYPQIHSYNFTNLFNSRSPLRSPLTCSFDQHPCHGSHFAPRSATLLNDASRFERGRTINICTNSGFGDRRMILHRQTANSVLLLAEGEVAGAREMTLGLNSKVTPKKLQRKQSVDLPDEMHDRA